MSGRLLLACLVATLALGCKAKGEASERASAELEPRPSLDEIPEPLVEAVQGHVHALAEALPGRSLDDPETLAAAATYVREQWQGQGYTVESQRYTVQTPAGQTHEVENLSVTLPGRRPELVVIGAHYDSAGGMPGADDNASGVAALLELSRRLKDAELDYGLVFVAFANEEPPYFKDPETMGSAVFARQLRESGAELEAMISIECVGYFSDEPDSQRYPGIVAALYPDTGNFLGVVGKNGSRPLVRAVREGLERHGPLPVETIAAPATITGIDWSDHWSFWEQGWPQAVMVTDTATFRNPNYHEPSDRASTLDYPRLAAVVLALDGTIRELASADD